MSTGSKENHRFAYNLLDPTFYELFIYLIILQN